MVHAFLFDRRRGERVVDWRRAAERIRRRQVLWVDLEEPDEDERRAVAQAFELDVLRAPGGGDSAPRLVQRDGRLHATLAAVNEQATDGPAAFPLRCVVGENWVVTVREAPVPVFAEFRRLAEGEGELGVLDGPSFLAALVEWTVGSYMRAFETIEARLERFDLAVLGNQLVDDAAQIGVLVDERRRIGELRRSLAPQRELFAVLSHAEFDLISSSESADRFAALTGRVDAALAAARDAKDSVVGSFDVLIARTERRTNEIMKVLTLASVLLLPGSLIAGVMGMNFSLGLFDHPWVFWLVLAAIALLALATTVVARLRRWI